MEVNKNSSTNTNIIKSNKVNVLSYMKTLSFKTTVKIQLSVTVRTRVLNDDRLEGQQESLNTYIQKIHFIASFRRK